MKNFRKTLAVTLTTGAFLTLSSFVHAAPFTWEFSNNYGSDYNNDFSGNYTGNTATADTSLSGLTLTYSAWANTNGSDGSGGADFDQQTLTSSGTHMLTLSTSNTTADCRDTRETCRWNDGSPNHAIDNEDAQEFVLFEFSEAVVLNELAIGWRGNDSDMTIMAYTGPGALPSLTGLSSNDILAAGDDFHIEHLANVPQNNSGVSFNTLSSVASRYWMVGAYNHHLGGGNGLSGGNDYMKLAMLGGFTPIVPPQDPPAETPEPGSLIILSLGLLGLRAASRRRAKA